MSNIGPLLIILIVSVITRNNLLAAATGIVLVLGFMNLQRLYPLFEKRGIELGLLFLTASLLIPFATGKTTTKDIIHTLTTPLGIFAIVGGILGAYLNGQGLDLIGLRPEIIPGILIGIVISVSFFGGVSVGPVMAAGFTAILMSIFMR